MLSNLRDLADAFEEVHKKDCELFDVYKLTLVSIKPYLVQGTYKSLVQFDLA